MLADNKAQLVSTHRAEDWQEAKRVSLERQAIKKAIVRHQSRYCECGNTKGFNNKRCFSCYLRNRFYKNQIPA